jgi:hypothetical protein
VRQEPLRAGPGRWRMDCREFLHRYSEYDDSLVPADEVAGFRDHMAECRACARYDRVLRKGRMLARQLPGPEPSPDFIPRLRRRLLWTPERDRGFRGARLAAGLAAATVLLVATSAVRLMESDQPAPEAGMARMADIEARDPKLMPARAAAPVLPAGITGPDRAWAAVEVATADTSSYSPLVTGPPAYRSRLPTAPVIKDSDRRAAD